MIRMRDQVGAEFRGLARLFRQRVLAADDEYIAAVRRITAPLEARLKRKPTLRPGMVIDTVRAWREMPTQYRLGLDADLDAKGALTITEWRLAATTANNTTWQTLELEPGVAIIKFNLSAARGRLNLTSVPHSVMSLHSLARWMERSGRRDDQSLVADIKALLTSNATERVPCPSGTWLASVIVAQDDIGRSFTCRDVRTYLSEDALVQEAASA